MSTNPEGRIVNALSRWLAGHVDNARLREEIELADPRLLSPSQAEAVEELLTELGEAGARRGGEVEVAVREALEALALG